jgi:phosphoribosylglycinamide formyltransferase-1
MNDISIAVLISGAGTTLQNLIQWKMNGELPAEFRLVIASRDDATGIHRATEANIPVEIVRRRDFQDGLSHSEHLFGLCRAYGVQLVVMGGFLDHLLIPEDYANRVINIHPSLIPAFCGRGYYGQRVHQAALDYGVKISGCTVHFVDDEFDHGPIIAQRACPVLENDTPHTLAGRVAEVERQLYPEVIAAIARDRVAIDDRMVSVRAIV